MKCIYCRQELRTDPYQGREGREMDCEVAGATMTIYVHDICLNDLIGDFIEQRIKAEKWSATSHCKGVEE